MLEMSVAGQSRTDLGKKASKLLRKEGLIPCNIYGIEKGENGLPVAKSFVVPFSEIRKVVYTPHVYVVNINIDGVEEKAVIKELQFHPVSDALLHVDFLEITAEKPVTVGIPVKLVGHAAGVRNGGRLALAVRQLKVTASYLNIPEILEIDVTPLEIGKSIKVGELHFEGLEFATSKEVVVCSVQMTRQARAAAQAAK